MKAPTPLTARFVETVTEPGRYGDGRGGHGLTLNVHRMLDGRISRSWIQRIRIGGRVTHLGLGAYPIVTLAEARRAALANRRTVAKGNDPRAGGVPTFADALDKVLDVQRPTWRDGGKSERQWRASLRDYAGPLMSKPVDAKEGPPKTFIGRPDTPLDECLRYTKWHTCDTTHRYDRFKDALRLFDGRDPEEAPKTSIAEAHVDIGCGAGLFSWAFIDWAIRGGLTFTKLRKLRLYGLDHCEQYLRLSRDIRELVLGSPQTDLRCCTTAPELPVANGSSPCRARRRFCAATARASARLSRVESERSSPKLPRTTSRRLPPTVKRCSQYRRPFGATTNSRVFPSLYRPGFFRVRT